MATNSGKLQASDKREWYISVLWPIAVLFVFLPTKNLFDYSQSPFNNPPATMDYLVFWYAGLETAAGRALELYNPLKFSANLVENFGKQFNIATWLYPPHVLAIYAGLSKLTFALGWLVFGVISLAAYLFSVAKIFPDKPRIALLCAISPATFICIMQGQTGILVSALLFAGLFAMPTRPILAGILIGLLTIKPQMGILIPFILIFERRFLTFAVASLTTLVLIAASMAWLGLDVWQQYLTSTMDGSSIALLKYIASLKIGSMLTLYGFASALGAPHEIAMTAQALTALGCLIATWFVVRSNIDLTSKIITYILLTYLVSPYVMSYDFSAATLAAAVVITTATYSKPDRILAYGIFFLPLIHIATEYLLVPLSMGFMVCLTAMMVRRCIQFEKPISTQPLQKTVGVDVH